MKMNKNNIIVYIQEKKDISLEFIKLLILYSNISNINILDISEFSVLNNQYSLDTYIKININTKEENLNDINIIKNKDKMNEITDEIKDENNDEILNLIKELIYFYPYYYKINKYNILGSIVVILD